MQLQNPLTFLIVRLRADGKCYRLVLFRNFVVLAWISFVGDSLLLFPFSEGGVSGRDFCFHWLTFIISKNFFASFVNVSLWLRFWGLLSRYIYWMTGFSLAYAEGPTQLDSPAGSSSMVRGRDQAEAKQPFHHRLVTW